MLIQQQLSQQQLVDALASAFPDVDTETMQELAHTYVRCIAREFRSTEAIIWIEPTTIAWTKLRNKCGMFVTGGQVLAVLDTFHKVVPLVAVIRQNSTFDNYSIVAVMLYPRLMIEHIHENSLLGINDSKYYATRDLLIDLYLCGPPLQPAMRLKLGQARRMIAEQRLMG